MLEASSSSEVASVLFEVCVVAIKYSHHYALEEQISIDDCDSGLPVKLFMRLLGSILQKATEANVTTKIRRGAVP